MCQAPKISMPAPPPAPPPSLDQLAPKSAKGDDPKARKKTGLSRYQIAAPLTSATNKLGGIPKKTGV